MMSLKFILCTITNVIAFFKRNNKVRKRKSSLPIVSVGASLSNYNPFHESATKSNKYWIYQNVNEVIEEADHLFREEQYLEVYEILNRIKYENNAEVKWRITRALFKMSCDKTLTNFIRNQMILEAFDLISNAILMESENSNVHKWMAIMIDARAGLESTNARIKAYDTVKRHLIKSSQLNPNDASVLYMLGKLCFDMSDFSWWQRKVSSLLFIEPPTSTYEEAYNYFQQAEQLKPRFYLPNLYLLGCASYHMKQYFRARYYLQEASQMIPRNSYEKKCSREALVQANKLRGYDVAKDVMSYACF